MKNVGAEVNTGPGASTEFPTGLVSGLLQSEPGAVLVQKSRKGYVSENKMSGISPNMVVIIPDVTVLPRTWAVYKLMNFLMENIHPQQSHRQCCWLCYKVHASPFPHKTAVSELCSFQLNLFELSCLLLSQCYLRKIGRSEEEEKQENNLELLCGMT